MGMSHCTLYRLSGSLKSPHQVWNILETNVLYLISELFGNKCIVLHCIVLYCIVLLLYCILCKTCSFYLYNATLFVKIASCRAVILLYEVVVSGRKCTKSGLNNTIHIDHWLGDHLGCRIDLTEWWCFFQFHWCCRAHNWHTSFLTLPPPKGNISVVKLDMAINEVKL